MSAQMPAFPSFPVTFMRGPAFCGRGLLELDDGLSRRHLD